MAGVDTRPLPVSILRWPRTRDLISQQKGILMYLWAHPSQTAAGVYLLPVDATAADLSMTSSSLVDALAEFQRRGLLEVDQETGEIFFMDWARWYTPRTPAARGAVQAAISKIQSAKLRKKAESSFESKLFTWKGKGKEKEKEAAADPAAASSRRNDKAPWGAPAHPRRGEEKVLWGVEVWTPGDEEGLHSLISLRGAAIVEAAAAGLDPAPGHRAPYLSQVSAALYAREVAAGRAAAEAHRQAILATPPQLDEEALARGAELLPPGLRRLAAGGKK